ncbi:MAG: SUMF1/EgtB/PvdO family nonheme iron enzyme [Polyangiaceae bacterium]
MSRSRVALAVGALLSSLSACDAPARPELVLVVDVDMPVSGQVGDGAAFSADAAVDTLRIEVFDADRQRIDDRALSIATTASLPLSFGIPSDIISSGPVLVRIRAFRGVYSTPGFSGDKPISDPIQEVTVDRLIELTLPEDGVVERHVTLHGDCMGVPIQFGVAGAPNRTCIDAEHPSAPALEEDSEETSVDGTVAGTWALAAVLPCQGTAPRGAVCIPGGLSVVGDPLFLARNELEYDAVPIRPTLHAPFFMDQTEVTVGELRALVADGYSGPLPTTQSAQFPDCTWSPATSADMPVNCILYAVADLVCAERGGTVPSEAQWEHAARGRGERRLFAWVGNQINCCSASLGRFPNAGCDGGYGAEPVKSHPGDDACPGDVSRDGVFDLTGSVGEIVLDTFGSYADACWQPDGPLAIPHDPICDETSLRLSRGAAWNAAFGDATLPARKSFGEAGSDQGFRCVYSDEPAP